MPEGMNAGGNNEGNGFSGITPEYIQRILYEELSKTGFQFDNMQNLVPAVINRVLGENSGQIAQYVSEKLVNGVMNQFFRGYKG